MSEPWRPANHLAWICRAPQLLDSPQSMALRNYLPDDWPSRLAGWASDAETRPACLSQPANPRLGYYFETLYEAVLTELLGFTLLARNLQVQDRGGRTLGELDFVVHNPHTGSVEHHEIAVKFYLGYATGEHTRWFGPNSRDRLDLKVARLLEHQSRLGERAETRNLLAELGIHEPVAPRIFMPGYLFYRAGEDAPVPAFVPQGHLRGQWLYHDDARNRDIRHWVPLHKPHWLGPWWQQEHPDAGLASTALASVAEYRRPRLFAALAQAPDTGLWHETARTFVVPSSWPGLQGGSP